MRCTDKLDLAMVVVKGVQRRMRGHKRVMKTVLDRLDPKAWEVPFFGLRALRVTRLIIYCSEVESRVYKLMGEVSGTLSQHCGPCQTKIWSMTVGVDSLLGVQIYSDRSTGSQVWPPSLVVNAILEAIVGGA